MLIGKYIKRHNTDVNIKGTIKVDYEKNFQTERRPYSSTVSTLETVVLKYDELIDADQTILPEKTAFEIF